MRILIVDENADFRLVLAEYLQEGLIQATRSAARRGDAPPGQLEIRHWDSVAGDFPVPGADSGLEHDVILIDSNIAPDDPVRWLTVLKGACQLVPPVVMLTSKRDPDDLAARIMPLGVVECVPRLQLTPRPENFSQLNLERMRSIYGERFASAKGMHFVMVGSFNVDAVKPLVARYLASLPAPDIATDYKDLGIRPVTGVVKKVVRTGSGVLEAVITMPLFDWPKAQS